MWVDGREGRRKGVCRYCVPFDLPDAVDFDDVWGWDFGSHFEIDLCI